MPTRRQPISSEWSSPRQNGEAKVGSAIAGVPHPRENGGDGGRPFFAGADAVQVAFHLDDGGDLLIDGKAVAPGALKKSPPDGSTKNPAAIFDG